jgi:thioesterase domain-containing protein
MADWTTLCAELQATWHREIPLAAAMGVAVESYDGKTLIVRAPFGPNRNVSGTAFAGSLFSSCVLTGWGATWLALRGEGLAGAIVAADSSIRYRRALTSDLICRCTPDPASVLSALEQLAAKGRASLDLVCTIDSEGREAVSFTSRYAVRAPHA